MKSIISGGIVFSSLLVRLTGSLVIVTLLSLADIGHSQALSVQSVSAIGTAQPIAPDSIVQITAESQGLQRVPPQEVPFFGTFWLVSPGAGGVVAAPLPCPPVDPTWPIYQMAKGQYLVDGTDGQILPATAQMSRMATTEMVSSVLAQQAASVVSLIDNVQAADASGPLPPGSGDGSTNTFDAAGYQAQIFTTNDLWLQFASQSNTVSSLIINVPWNTTDSNFMFDVFATTNLLPNVPGLNLTNWMLVRRSTPGQTNLTISPLPGAPICFFRLGTVQDTDGDGLTDAFEKLVSHTNPNVWDSNGNGIGDGDEIGFNGFPWCLEAVRLSSAVIYANSPTATQGGTCGQCTVYLPNPAPAGGTIVQYYLGGSAALNSDFTLTPSAGQLTIPAGYSSGTITLCASSGSTYSDVNLYSEITADS